MTDNSSGIIPISIKPIRIIKLIKLLLCFIIIFLFKFPLNPYVSKVIKDLEEILGRLLKRKSGVATAVSYRDSINVIVPWDGDRAY